MAGTSTLTAVLDHSIEPNTIGRHQTYYGTISVLADTGTTDYAAGGLTLSFLGVVPHKSPPIELKVWSEAVANGYVYQVVPNASPTISNAKVAIFQGTATAVPAAQITGAMPAAIGTSGAGGTTVGKLRWRGTWIHGK